MQDAWGVWHGVPVLKIGWVAKACEAQYLLLPLRSQYHTEVESFFNQKHYTGDGGDINIRCHDTNMLESLCVSHIFGWKDRHFVLLFWLCGVGEPPNRDLECLRPLLWVYFVLGPLRPFVGWDKYSRFIVETSLISNDLYRLGNAAKPKDNHALSRCSNNYFLVCWQRNDVRSIAFLVPKPHEIKSPLSTSNPYSILRHTKVWWHEHKPPWK